MNIDLVIWDEAQSGVFIWKGLENLSEILTFNYAELVLVFTSHIFGDGREVEHKQQKYFQHQTPSVNSRSLAYFTSSSQVNSFLWIYFFSKLLVSISYMGDIFGYIWGEYACVRLIYLNIFDVNTLVSAGYICGQMLTGNRWINMAGDRYMQIDLYTNVMQGWIILVLSFGFKWFANVKKITHAMSFFGGVSSKDTCYSESGASGELHRD